MEHIPINDPVRRYRNQRDAIDFAVKRVIESGWWLNGQEVPQFAREFATWCGAAHCVPVSNGTDALEFCMRALNVVAGDEIITVANAGGYTTSVCRLIGAIPTWVDVSAGTLGLDLDRVAEAVTNRTRAVVVTHLYGIPVDVPRLRSVLNTHGAASVKIIEDCAQAHGARIGGVRAGAMGDAAAFSFYPSKNLGALGDAGAVVTNDGELAERVMRLQQYGWRERYNSIVPMGRNSRMDEIQAAVLRVKLPHVEGWNASRRNIIARYTRELRAPLRVVGADNHDSVGHLAVVRVPGRDRFRERMAQQGIGTDIHYPVLDMDQPSQQGLPGRAAPLTESKRAIAEIVTLPCFPELTHQEVDKIVYTANEIAGEL